MKLLQARLYETTAERDALRAELAESKEEVEFKEALRVELRDTLDTARSEVARALRGLAECKAELKVRVGDILQARDEFDMLKADLAALTQELADCKAQRIRTDD